MNWRSYLCGLVLTFIIVITVGCRTYIPGYNELDVVARVVKVHQQTAGQSVDLVESGNFYKKISVSEEFLPVEVGDLFQIRVYRHFDQGRNIPDEEIIFEVIILSKM